MDSEICSSFCCELIARTKLRQIEREKRHHPIDWNSFLFLLCQTTVELSNACLLEILCIHERNNKMIYPISIFLPSKRNLVIPILHQDQNRRQRKLNSTARKTEQHANNKRCSMTFLTGKKRFTWLLTNERIPEYRSLETSPAFHYFL